MLELHIFHYQIGLFLPIAFSVKTLGEHFGAPKTPTPLKKSVTVHSQTKKKRKDTLHMPWNSFPCSTSQNDSRDFWQRPQIGLQLSWAHVCLTPDSCYSQSASLFQPDRAHLPGDEIGGRGCRKETGDVAFLIHDIDEQILFWTTNSTYRRVTHKEILPPWSPAVEKQRVKCWPWTSRLEIILY